MAQTVILSFNDRERLAAIIGDRRRPLKHVQRARIVLLSAEQLPVLEVARRIGVSRPAVWRWQQARPPGKRNSSIHLLSGGEKTLTAIGWYISDTSIKYSLIRIYSKSPVRRFGCAIYALI